MRKECTEIKKMYRLVRDILRAEFLSYNIKVTFKYLKRKTVCATFIFRGEYYSCTYYHCMTFMEYRCTRAGFNTIVERLAASICTNLSGLLLKKRGFKNLKNEV